MTEGQIQGNGFESKKKLGSQNNRVRISRVHLYEWSRRGIPRDSGTVRGGKVKWKQGEQSAKYQADNLVKLNYIFYQDYTM